MVSRVPIGNKKRVREWDRSFESNYPLIPPNSHIWILVAALHYVYFKYSLWPYAIALYIIAVIASPVSKRTKLVQRLLLRTFSKKFENLPWRFNVCVLAELSFGFWFRVPVEAFLWYLDELLFPSYKKTKIQDPVFVVGQPRSGTTKFLDVLCEDAESYCCLKLYEIRYPFLTVQYTIDFLARFDNRFLGGKALALLDWAGCFGVLKRKGERGTMRRTGYNLPDEDDLIFLYHCLCHELMVALCPDPTMIRHLCKLAKQPKDTRDQFMNFHRRAVQKVLYRRGGNGRRYLAKWAASWNGHLSETRDFYPGGKYIVIVRDPLEQLPSWMKLQGLLSRDMTANNFMTTCPAVRRAVVEMMCKPGYQSEIEFCKTTPRERLCILRFSDFVADIPQTIKRARKFLDQDQEIIVDGSMFDQRLKAHSKEQASHKTTTIRSNEVFISQKQIEEEFPHLLKEIEFDE